MGRGLLVLVFPRTHTRCILTVFRVNPHSATLTLRDGVEHTSTQEKDRTLSLLTQDSFIKNFGSIFLSGLLVILLTDAELPYGP